MPSELISESIIARLVIKSLLPFVHEETSPFRCSWIANVEPEDRRMTVDDFVAWHVSPMVRSAICYTDDGAGKELTKNASYGGSVH